MGGSEHDYAAADELGVQPDAVGLQHGEDGGGVVDVLVGETVVDRGVTEEGGCNSGGQ